MNIGLIGLAILLIFILAIQKLKKLPTHVEEDPPQTSGTLNTTFQKPILSTPHPKLFTVLTVITAVIWAPVGFIAEVALFGFPLGLSSFLFLFLFLKFWGETKKYELSRPHILVHFLLIAINISLMGLCLRSLNNLPYFLIYFILSTFIAFESFNMESRKAILRLRNTALVGLVIIGVVISTMYL